MGDTDVEANTARTNLAMPLELRDRVMVHARADLRSFKAEILALLDEAMKARERRGKTST